ncbi:MAG: cytochrome P450 [Sphingomonadales bacterium]|nr:MAG: cytochrome P450 [Sphingomonadales bacterium]
MQTIAELDLPHLPMESPEFSADPWPQVKAAAAKHPWAAKVGFGYAVHQYEAIKDLLWLDDKMRGAYESIVEIMDAHGTPWGTFQEVHLLSRNGPSHKQLRDVLAPAFTPRQANIRRELMRSVIIQQLDEWAPKGAFDFELFSSWFPINVMCRMIGAPIEAIPGLRSSLEVMGGSTALDKSKLPALQDSYLTLAEFARGLVDERRKTPNSGGEGDIIDVMLAAEAEGKINEQEIVDAMVFMFVAGYDTSKNALTLLMWVLADRPEDYKRCGEDLDFCKKVVEENFRYITTSTIPRLTTADIEYKGTLIPKDTLLFFLVNVSGRDTRTIPNAEEFIPERTHENRHVAFGRGMHMCLGQHIARAQIEEGLHQICKRLKNPRITGASAWRPIYGVWGLRGLPIEFDPA